MTFRGNVLNKVGIVLVVFALLFDTMLVLTPSSSAISSSDWQAGNIISDYNFYDNNQMSADGIQQWLNNNLSCDTNGQKVSEYSGGSDLNRDGKVTRAEWAQSVYGYTGKFVCLRDYYENPSTGQSNLITGVAPAGSVSAAQIIKQAADTYQINPKVLLVKLRKESPGPLTQDEWPWPSQFDAALGYACPDPPAGQPVVCDPKYKGFYNQIHYGARGLRNYVTYSSSYRYKPYQNNSILYNPNTGCGSSSVYIANYATAGLYNYTPYQPNQAALDNMYGNGDGCSAYGNRNFWTMYTNMFGSTRTSLSGVRASSSSSYAQAPCSIPSFGSDMVGRLYHPDLNDYLYTTSRVEACLAVGYGYIWDGLVMQNAEGSPGSMPVYRLSNYERHLFTSSASVRDQYINSQGYKDEGISFYAYSSPGVDTTPVYGLQKDQLFFFTGAGKEAEQYQNEGFFNFGTIFYTKNLATQPTPVYRITNRSHTRLYTTSAVERDLAIKYYGYANEGTVSTNDQYPNNANTPIYRLRSPWGTYFFTASRYERDLAVINYGYYSEGASFYSLAYSMVPVYRALNPATAQRIYTNSAFEYYNAMSQYSYIGESIGWYSY